MSEAHSIERCNEHLSSCSRSSSYLNSTDATTFFAVLKALIPVLGRQHGRHLLEGQQCITCLSKKPWC